MNIKLIANPASCRGKFSRYRDAIMGKLSAAGEVSVSETRKSGDFPHLASLLRERKYDTVVIAGGDGTVNDVANAVFTGGFSVPVGIIPVGAGNLFSDCAEIPHDPLAACDVILRGRTRKIDAGRIMSGSEERYFILMLGMGFDARGAELMDERKKWRKVIGSFATHILVGMEEMFTYEPPLLSVKSDGCSYEGYHLIISNGKLHAGGVRIAPSAEMDDGFLDASLFEEKAKMKTVRYLMDIITGVHPKGRGVKAFRSEKIKVSSDVDKIVVQTDGEAFRATLPFEVQVMPGLLSLIVP